MWYRWYRDVIGSFYLGGINEICDVFISKNFHFPLVIWQFFSSNFKLKFSFQISKNENFQFFCFKILWHISIFSSPSSGTAKIFKFNSKLFFFNFFHFPMVGWPNFFQNSKTKFSIQISKTIF
jgi:hypothetical protein